MEGTGISELTSSENYKERQKMPEGFPKNYFEKIVHRYISQFLEDEKLVFDAMALALNNLPPRYYCSDNCMNLITKAHKEDLEYMAEVASKKAIHFVKKHPEKKDCDRVSKSKEIKYSGLLLEELS